MFIICTYLYYINEYYYTYVYIRQFYIIYRLTFLFMLYILGEINTNGYIHYFLNILFLMAILSSIYVIISSNPIFSVLYLIFLFAIVAIYLILIDLKFIGISYLLVYVGAVTILFLFILMLINIRISEITDYYKNSFPLGLLITIFFIIPISHIISINTIESSKDKINIFFASSNSWDKRIAEVSDIHSLGNIMYSSFSLWLIITSIVLLLAMVGAIVINIR